MLKKCITILLALVLVFSVPGRLILPVSASTLPFTDVSTSHQYYDSIAYVYENGYMAGIDSDTFDPNSSVTRAMIVTILYSMSGSTMKRAPTGFTDVPSTSYYYYPVGWAQYYGIVSGTSNTTFSPNNNVNRQDFLLILYGYLTKYEDCSYALVHSSLVENLSDYSSISSYARTAVNWAMNCDIVSSTAYSLAPKSSVSRGLCAKYIHYAVTLCTGEGRSLADTGLSPSTAEEISELMVENGIAAHLNYDLTPVAMEFVFRNSTMVYTHSHGGDSCIQLGNRYLYSSDIDSGSLKNASLIYVSACYAGGTFCETLFQTGGADYVIGFDDTVSAVGSKDGIHYFNQRFFMYYLSGFSIDIAIQKAKYDIWEMFGNYYGADSIHVYS